jgi:K+ transporter
MNPIVLGKIAAIVIAVLAIFFTGEKVERSKWQERELELNNQAVAVQAAAAQRVAEVSSQYEQLKSSKQMTQTTLSRNLSNEIAQNRSQYECPVPSAARVLLNTSIANANNSSASQSSTSVPKNK